MLEWLWTLKRLNPITAGPSEMQILRESLGERLKQLREGKSISVKELSDKIGVPLTTEKC